MAPHRGGAHLVGPGCGRHIVRHGKVSWDVRHAVGKIGETGRGQRGLEKRDDRGKLRHDHYELETVDLPVSWVFVMEVKSVTHVIRPHDIKPETKGFAIGTASDRTRIAKADGGGVAGKNMTDRD